MNNTILYPFSKQLMFAKVMEDRELCRDMLRIIFPDRKVKDIIVHKREISVSEATVITGMENGVASIRIADCKELLPQPVHQLQLDMNRLRGVCRKAPTLRSNSLHSLLSVLHNQA